MTMGLRDWLLLAMTAGLGPITTRRLIEAWGAASAAWAAGEREVKEVPGIGAAGARKIAAALREAARGVEDEMAKAARLGVRLLCPDDEAYPALLRDISDPPAILYVKGKLEARDLHALAIVGSRKCSFYGREQATRFAGLLAGAGLTIVSGGARGVDAAAHRGALAHPQGRTLCVLGCGVDVAYPPENAELFFEISQRGAVISELPLGSPPMAENFPRRNRIISGLSRGVLVIEAAERSGALITARLACDDHGRTVFALPGQVDNPLSAGPHQLIRDGAALVGKLEDILDALGPLPQGAVEEGEKSPASPVMLSDRQKLLIEHMGGSAVGVDALIERTGLEAPVVLQELTYLSLKGVVQRADGQTFVLHR